MGDDELRAEAKSLYADWHDNQFECHPSAVKVSDDPRYHADILEQAFIDAFVWGFECGANASVANE